MQSSATTGELQYLEGVAAAKREDWGKAVDSFVLASDQMPEVSGIWNDLGVALMRTGQLNRSVAAFRKGLATCPKDPMLMSNLAACLSQSGDTETGAVLAEQAVAATCDIAVCTHAANVLTQAGRFASAAAALGKAIENGGGSAAVWANLASALYSSGRTKDAHAAQRTALALAPTNRAIQSNLLFSLNLHEDLSAEAVADVHFDWGKAVAAAVPQEFDFSGKDRTPEKRLRVGILTADLKAHSVSYFAAPIIPSTAGCEVTIFSTVKEPNAATARFKAMSENWVDLVGVAESESARIIFEAEIDVLVELGGHTSPVDLQILARKPAPVQITYLSYAATTGLPAVDFLITDPVADPAGCSEHLYSERLVRLDPCLLCYEPPQPESPIGERRSGERFMFGCFAQRHKISAGVIDLWAAILREADTADLFLKASAWSDPLLKEEILAGFESQGVPRARITLDCHKAALGSHLKRYECVDLALDTMPYGGITTTCESLWMGVPVLTLRGKAQVSRTCASILSAVGLDELITKTPQEYVSRAVRMATGQMPFPARGERLRARLKASPIMDATKFREQWDRIMRDCWRDWCRLA